MRQPIGSFLLNLSCQSKVLQERVNKKEPIGCLIESKLKHFFGEKDINLTMVTYEWSDN